MATPIQQEIEGLEKKQEWWWAAEKKRSKRLDYLRKAIWKNGAIGGNYNPGIKVDLEFARLFTNEYFSDWDWLTVHDARATKEQALARLIEDSALDGAEVTLDAVVGGLGDGASKGEHRAGLGVVRLRVERVERCLQLGHEPGGVRFPMIRVEHGERPFVPRLACAGQAVPPCPAGLQFTRRVGRRRSRPCRYLWSGPRFRD